MKAVKVDPARLNDVQRLLPGTCAALGGPLSAAVIVDTLHALGAVKFGGERLCVQAVSLGRDRLDELPVIVVQVEEGPPVFLDW